MTAEIPKQKFAASQLASASLFLAASKESVSHLERLTGFPRDQLGQAKLVMPQGKQGTCGAKSASGVQSGDLTVALTCRTELAVSFP